MPVRKNSSYIAHKTVFSFFLFFFFISCNKKPPAAVLPTEKMIEIITDLQLADAAYKLEMLPEGYKNQPQKYYVEILRTHQTDSAIYNLSLVYYAENPQLLKKIYTGVEKNIQTQDSKPQNSKK